ncbi:MAG: hypothetical protein QOI06_1571 [Nocardioidaceae bacterium]|nr:hypothetical protein [Nocardioidaceae bacterium]
MARCTYLTNSKGLSLYMFASDTAGKSSCSGPCVTYWPPVTATGKATAGRWPLLTNRATDQARLIIPNRWGLKPGKSLARLTDPKRASTTSHSTER